MISKFFKSDKGFAASDTLIALLIITLFVGLISTISYNIYIANSSIKRMSKANSYIIDVFEYIDKSYYNDINVQNLANYFNANVTKFDIINGNLGNEVIISSNDFAQILGNTNKPPYKIEITIDYYNKLEGNTDKFDLVKEITAKVTYQLGSRNQIIEMKTTKQREILEVPNKPDISKITLVTGEKKTYPVKKEGSIWKVCNLNDKSWYNYENGNWAVAFTSSDENLNVGDTAEQTVGTFHFWIPRYAYSNTDVKFLFKDSNKYVESYIVNEKEYKKLVEIDNTYTICTNFTSSDNVKLNGIWETDTTSSVYTTLNEVYPFQ